MSRIHKIQFTALFAALLALVGSLFAVAQAAFGDDECRTIENITICAEKVKEDFDGNLVIFSSELDFIKIGPAGKPPVVFVSSQNVLGGPRPDQQAVVTYDRDESHFGRLIHARGQFIFKDSGSFDPLVEADAESINSSLPSSLFIDPLSQRIYNPSHEQWASFYGSLPELATRNSGMKLNFLEDAGLAPLFATPNAYLLDLQDVDYEFDLQTKQFRARIPISLKVSDDAENANIKVYANLVIGSDGRMRGTVDDFKVNLSGFVAEARNVVLRPGSLNTPAEFEAAAVEISKAKNPDFPALDPKNSELIFRFERLKYSDGRFSIAGGAASLPDWKFGETFQMINQQVGLNFDPSAGVYSMVMTSTLLFPQSGIVEDPIPHPLSLRVGTYKVGDDFKPFVHATVATKPVLEFGLVRISPENMRLVIDPRQNFYGLEAEKVSLGWKSEFGSAESGGITGMRLGLDRNGDLVFNLGGGTLRMPEARSKAISFSDLTATISSTDTRAEIVMNGTAEIILPGNSGAKPTAKITIRRGEGVCANGPNCVKPVDFTLTSFGLKIAGFGFELKNPSGSLDGGFGFGVDKATLKLPEGLGGYGAEVNWLKVSGNGDISVGGGGFELPNLKVGSFELASLRGQFAKLPDGGYEFQAKGVIPLPSTDPTATSKSKIGAGVKIRTAKGGDVREAAIEVEFATNPPGIPIAGTGFELMQITGVATIDRDNSDFRLNVKLRADSSLRLASYPLAKVDGEFNLGINPFFITGDAKLTVVIFEAARAHIGLGAGEGFQGGWGFNASLDVEMTLIKGRLALRMGEIKLDDGREKFAVAAEAKLKIGLEEDQFYSNVPPWDITLAEVGLKGGYFNVKGKGQVAGMLGTVGCCVFFEGTVFVNMSDWSIDLVDVDDYSLIGAAQVRERAAQGVAGYSSRRLNKAEANALGFTEANNGAAVLQETVPFEVRHAGTTLIGISYPGGSPRLRLQLPDGSIISEAQVDNTTIGLLRQANRPGKEDDLLFMLKNAQPGQYLLYIDNAPASYEKVSYTMNNTPSVGEVSASCNGDQPAEGVTISCDGASAGSSATVNWVASDADSPEAHVIVGYAPIREGQADLTDLRVLTDTMAMGAGSFTWDLSGVPSGSYHMVVRAHDGQNAPADVIAPLTVTVDDRRAPAIPNDVAVIAQPNGMLVNWPAVDDDDLAGYEIGYALEQGGTLVYTRDLGLKDISLAGERVEARLWNLLDNQLIWVTVRSYDQNGNYSDWAVQSPNTSWALAPYAMYPLPEQTGYPDEAVLVSFATPLAVGEELSGLLSLRDAEGNPRPGRVEAVYNISNDMVIGLRFVPATPLAVGATYYASLSGGSDGVAVIDGREMPEGYQWSFRVAERPAAPEEPASGTMVYLPMVVR
jgi:hypothetical protein